MDKIKEMLGSNNFLVTIFTIVSMVFTYNQVELGLTPDELADNFKGGEGALLTTAIMLFLNPLIKIVKKTIEDGFNFAFIRSTNFLIQLGSAILLVVGAYLNQMELINVIIATITANTGNLMIHSMSPAKKRA